jgi:hypothetical protein
LQILFGCSDGFFAGLYFGYITGFFVSSGGTPARSGNIEFFLLCRGAIPMIIIMGSLKIHFGGQTNLFGSDRRQEKLALATIKADFPSLSEFKNFLLAAQKQLLELP